MRVDRPAKLLSEAGYKVTVGPEVNPDADVLIFQKHMNQRYDAAMVSIFKGNKKVIFDVADSHFNGKLHDYYASMINAADLVTASGPNLAEQIKEITGKDSSVCNDPITFPHYPYRPGNKDTPSLLWFGSATNLGPLHALLHEVGDTHLTVISNPHPMVPGPDGKPPYEFIEWQPNLVETEIWKYDAVIIPIGDDPTKQNKNTNRAVDALMAGRFVITDSMRVYGELEPFIFIGPLDQGIQFLKDNPDKVKQMVKDGQDYVREKYSDVVIKQQWKSAVEKVLSV